MSCFSKFLNRYEEYSKLQDELGTQGFPLGAIGLPDINKVCVIHSLCENLEKKAFVITPDDATAVKVYEDLSTLQDGVLLYPRREFTFIEVEGISREYEQIRLGVLSKILKNDYSVVVASVSAACQLTMPPEALRDRIFSISTDEELDIDATVKKLVKAGYTRCDQVEGTSQFSVRGGIVDIFPPGADSPYRIELWGDMIDSITKFDVSTQRRNETVNKIDIIPSTEVLFASKEDQAKRIEAFANGLKGKVTKVRERLYEDCDKLKQGLSLRCNDKYLPLAYESNGLFDYASDMLFVCESAKTKEKCENHYKLMLEDLKWLVDDGIICKGLDRFVLSFDELCQIYTDKGAIYLDSLPRGSFDTPVRYLANFTCQSFNSWNGTMSQLQEELLPMLKNGYAIAIMAGTSRSAKALANDIMDLGYPCAYSEDTPSAITNGVVTVLKGTLSAGFQLSGCKLMVVTYGKFNSSKKKNKKFNSKDAIHSIDELNPGDYIVHVAYGIGIFEGIQTMQSKSAVKDYIKISYAHGDALYVPVTQLDRVSKYIGSKEDAKVKINRLGTNEWERTKARVKENLKEMAKELISLYAKRMSTPGFAFNPDDDLQHDFDLRFEYEETDDQLRCVEEIKRDMERPHPMDRLLCGDVGFGKTEVALRACFKCITSGKQCAILVPTTVLAMQHYQTALKRMEAYPIRIEMLSRFVPAKKQKQILKDLKAGKVDLVIGTHRIFGGDIQFKDLGLLVVDEEQRFGVAQKEKIKEKFPCVDVLTLSATPIPRTLNMAMSGIRDMSLIEEAPGDRKPVQTYVIEYDFGVLVEAMEKELARGGQCYYLHNDINSISLMASRIKKEIPDATVGIAHGKMTEEELSDVWQGLLNGEIDILVCTTIIETGVDVPNVNTLIIENANRMGLAQLHQIRGRVGRSSRRGYAYFTFARGTEISDIAQRRLEAIREYTEFGSGFKIAMRDLEIRGAGSLLGNKQHGHLEAVGYDMYIKLLEEAVATEKGEYIPVEKQNGCTLDLQIDATIPNEYISSTPQRLEMYKQIASISSQEDANSVYEEFTDRFGTPPPSVYGLIEISLLRNLATELSIYEVKQLGKSIKFFINDVKPEYLVALNEKMRDRAKFVSGQKSYINVEIKNEESLDVLRNTLTLLQASVSNNV